MNRRNFIAGSIALAGQRNLLRSMGAVPDGGQNEPKLVAPHNLFTTTYPESFLQSKLLSANEWHPYPKCSDRAPWEAVPADIRAAFLAKAEADQKAGWAQLPATMFLNFKRNGNQSIYENASFGRRGQLGRMVLAECMENKGRFLDDITNGIWAICEESFWGDSAHMYMQHAGVGLPDVTDPIVDLFAAVTVENLAWTRYLLGEQLDGISPLINKRIVVEAERRILTPARQRNDFWWMGLDGSGRKLNNWNPWINSNLLVANLLLEEDPKLRLQEMVRITRSIDQYLNQYSPDAGEEEGPRYFTVSPMCLFECITFLELATGSSTKIFANPFIDAMGRYILAAHIAGEDYINYGDADVKAGPDGDLLYRYGRAVRDDQLQAFGAWLAAKEGWTATGEALTRAVNAGLTFLSRSIPAVLQASEIRGAHQEDVLIRDAWYPDLGLMTAREKAGTTDGMYVAVLAANNGRSHSHNDTGSFIIYRNGRPVTIDVGVGTYNAKTFSADRYSIWTMQSAYHNLPTIGGVMQQNGAEYRATDRKYASNDERAMYSFNLAATYPQTAGVKSWIRTVTLDRLHGKVVIQENVELERDVPVSLSIMTSRLASMNGDGAITMTFAGAESDPTSLRFNAAELEAVIEKRHISDAHLHAEWGDSVCRILLNSRQRVAKGSWTYEFSHA